MEYLDVKIRTDWEEIKNDVIKIGLREKFLQHEELKKRLIETCDKILFDNSPYNIYVAQGKNMIGKLLMEIRNEII